MTATLLRRPSPTRPSTTLDGVKRVHRDGHTPARTVRTTRYDRPFREPMESSETSSQTR